MEGMLYNVSNLLLNVKCYLKIDYRLSIIIIFILSVIICLFIVCLFHSPVLPPCVALKAFFLSAKCLHCFATLPNAKCGQRAKAKSFQGQIPKCLPTNCFTPKGSSTVSLSSEFEMDDDDDGWWWDDDRHIRREASSPSLTWHTHNSSRIVLHSCSFGIFYMLVTGRVEE